MTHPKASKEEKKHSEKQFTQALKKQIMEISSKYIIKDITLNQAFLFLPAEAIFAEINAHHPKITQFAHNNNISIVSPTTLMAMLTIVANAIRSMETQKHAQVIQSELEIL
jgi:DNA recombination protein RmuC